MSEFNLESLEYYYKLIQNDYYYHVLILASSIFLLCFILIILKYIKLRKQTSKWTPNPRDIPNPLFQPHNIPTESTCQKPQIYRGNTLSLSTGLANNDFPDDWFPDVISRKSRGDGEFSGVEDVTCADFESKITEQMRSEINSNSEFSLSKSQAQSRLPTQHSNESSMSKSQAQSRLSAQHSMSTPTKNVFL
ncbi:hypothetical protein QTN25_006733 [Entamoeba marina]